MQVERALIRPEGLRTRPWFRNLIYVADENNGYANMALPSVNEAIRANDETLTRNEIADLAARFTARRRRLPMRARRCAVDEAQRLISGLTESLTDRPTMTATTVLTLIAITAMAMRMPTS